MIEKSVVVAIVTKSYDLVLLFTTIAHATTREILEMSVAAYVMRGNLAICVATKLRDKLNETLPSVRLPLILGW